MMNTYEVADRVKVLIVRTLVDPKTGEEKTWEDFYAGTVITYHDLPDPETGEMICLYKVSVDGVGDIKIAKEKEINGKLEIVTDPKQIALIA